jgi:hypothetical protein
MGDSSTVRRNVVISLGIASLLFFAGWRLMPTEGSWGAIFPILGGILCFLLGACVLAVPLASSVADPWGSFYFSTRMPDGKAPMYGIPQSKRKKGQFREAMAAYEAITLEYPTELRAYVEMMDLAVVDLNDLWQAEQIFAKAQLAIQNEDDRRSLEAMHRAITSRQKSRQDLSRPNRVLTHWSGPKSNRTGPG